MTPHSGLTPSYSKARVDAAGRTLVEWARLSKPQRDLQLKDPARAQELLVADAVVNWWRREHARPLTRVNAGLRYYLAPHGRPNVTQRLKKWSTIVHKLTRHPTMRLSAMQDIGGVRAVLRDQERVDDVVRRLRSNWRRRVAGVDDYARTPKPSGYRAVHLIVVQDGRRIEIQLRTPWQDLWAQSAEEDTSRLGLGLKFGVGPDDLREYYRLMGDIMSAREEGRIVDAGVLAYFSKLHPEMRRYFARHRDES